MRASERATVERAVERLRNLTGYARGSSTTMTVVAIKQLADDLAALLDTPPDPDGEISVKLTRDEVSALARATAWMPGVLYRDHIQHWDSGLAKLKAVLENPDARP